VKSSDSEKQPGACLKHSKKINLEYSAHHLAAQALWKYPSKMEVSATGSTVEMLGTGVLCLPIDMDPSQPTPDNGKTAL
jgi:hypothetical protein